jgi:hypothetical protein
MNHRQLANSQFPRSGSQLADRVHEILYSTFLSISSAAVRGEGYVFERARLQSSAKATKITVGFTCCGKTGCFERARL